MKNNVSEYRKQRQLSQVSLAALAGISRPYLSEIECGKQRVISNIVMVKISNALQVPIEQVFFAPNVVCTQQSKGRSNKNGLTVE